MSIEQILSDHRKYSAGASASLDQLWEIETDWMEHVMLSHPRGASMLRDAVNSGDPHTVLSAIPFARLCELAVLALDEAMVRAHRRLIAVGEETVL